MKSTKIFIVLSSLFVIVFCVANHLTHSKNAVTASSNYVEPNQLLLQSTNKPTQELESLLTLLQVKHDGTLDSIVKATQEQWLRQAGKERWQVEEVNSNLKDAIVAHAQKLGVVNEIAPSKKHYTYVLILGATLSRVRSRLAHLIELHKQGVRFDMIICLGSERSLDKEIENETMLLDLKNNDIACRQGWTLYGSLPKNEHEMMQFVFEQSDIPQEMKNIPVVYINAPNVQKPDGTIRRANTGDTIELWLKSNPLPANCLFISSQPYVGYQDSVVRTYIPASFGEIETVGPKARSNVRNAEILDTLARSLYQEKIRRKSK